MAVEPAYPAREVKLRFLERKCFGCGICAEFMEVFMRIILDVMGADKPAAELVRGAVLAKNEYQTETVLVGNERIIREALAALEVPAGEFEIVHSDDVITMEDSPMSVFQTHKDCSMAKTLKLVAEGKGDAAVSAGNTGAYFTGATLIVRRIHGIRRAALGTILPFASPLMMLDCGANVTVTPDYLAQFACLGSVYMEKVCGKDTPYEENPAAVYAAVRNALYDQVGKKIEIMVNYQPKLHFMSEWWKQLYGESEGKDGKGIFPASCDFTTDLHSMGQWIQQGERSIYETVISIEKPNRELLFPNDEENLDGLNFLAGKRVDEVNKMAELGTRLAHVDGGVPNIRVSVPQLNEYYLGQLIYFFEIACGISGNVLGVNPFNQPGVEAYKKNMFALLDKPGYEAESKAIKERLANEK